jgi:hypothetical protein
MAERKRSAQLEALAAESRRRLFHDALQPAARQPRPAAEAPLGARIFASDVLLDLETHDFFVDGVRLPWHLREVPTIEPYEQGFPITAVTFTIFVDGTVRIRGDRASVIDPVLGDVREYVRREFQQAFPWLRLPDPTLPDLGGPR